MLTFIFFYKLRFYISISFIHWIKWSSREAHINFQQWRTSLRKPSTSSTQSTLPTSKPSDKKSNLHLKQRSMYKDLLKNHTYTHSMMPTTQCTQAQWNGWKQWVKFQDQNKYLPITNISVLPEDMPWLSGLVSCFWDLSDQLRISSCLPNHQAKLGSSSSHTSTSILKVRNISWCQCWLDSIQRSQLWKSSTLKLTIKKTLKPDAEILWLLPSHKLSTRVSTTTTLPSEITHFST